MAGESKSTAGLAARLVPASLVVLSALAAVMLLVALGVALDLLPQWTREIVGTSPESGADGDRIAIFNRILPVCSTLVGVTFVFALFRRYARRGGTHLLIWGIGLTFFATGSFTESLHGFLGWNDWVFRFWYLFGAVLIAAWMGQGTIHLLAKKSTARVVLLILIAASLFASHQVLLADLDPALIASGVEQLEMIDGTEKEGRAAASRDFTETEVLRLAAALLRQPALDDSGRVNRRRLSPLARSVNEAALNRMLPGATVPEAELSRREPGAEADRVSAEVILAGTVEGRAVTVRHVDGSEPGETLLVALDGTPIARLRLRPAIVFSGHVITSPGVRSLTPFFNIFGTIALIGGAIYSAWVFYRQRVMPHRVVGNVLIAAGAILGGGGSAFARFGMLSYLYLAELASLVIMFAGFVVATREVKPEEASSP